MLKLPTLLEGEALAVWLELSQEEQKDIVTAKEKMIQKMAPTARVYMFGEVSETENVTRRSDFIIPPLAEDAS